MFVFSLKVRCTICENKPCGSGRTCTPLLTYPGYECTCFAGFLAPNCTDHNECSMAPAVCNNGSCVNTQGGYHCACFKGFTGTHCNNVMEACGSSPCKNGSTSSVASDGSHVCNCNVGFNQSKDCDVIDECNMVSDHNPCSNGTCVNTQGSFYCSCNAGYQSKFCQDDVDECLRDLSNVTTIRDLKALFATLTSHSDYLEHACTADVSIR
ncbi:delta-like protein 1 [Mya arenaria]|uniref:delta-like protein 1 n=1 Tax=Mya arenaria TaxID=6604 RepID=UPI0022E5DF7A|nr:delta-like protein 1 [Mya arenaria]